MTKMMLRTVVVALVAIAGGSWAVSAEDAPKPKLEGQYVVTAGERDGKPIPEADITGCTFRFAADKVNAADKNGKDFLAATYTLDPANKPCAIVLKMTGSGAEKEWHGLVEQTGDTARIVYAIDGGERPTEFKTKEKQVMFSMKRQEQK